MLLAVLLMSMRFVSDGYKVGDTVADFKLKNVDGKAVSLADRKDVKGYIIAFTCNTCPVAKAYESRIIALNEQFAPKGYPVVAIQSNDEQRSPGDSYGAMQQRARGKSYGFPYLHDETQAVAKAFGATNTPHMFVLKKEGDAYKVAYIGAIDNNQRDAAAADKKYVEQAVTELLAGKPVTMPTARAIGCGIKWRDA
ncbi:alkyl hydroperoxide reductase/thiol specific antioxidant/Mal allergen [Fibrisoma limi BUZ 3]|uniref:Alkyl hydroperoxide reductase/thiol specific antioxidant/Mal allergen n=2 Tax=Fibrisoma limi TaxID=663275 RepID=I2GKG2_9BACT|nr:alkyl hydroperoxide reductase/thiol specific antioxidant/Mal allergen [Fibrisoma limi BUZ 3]